MDCLSFSLVLSFDGSIEKNLEKIDRWKYWNSFFVFLFFETLKIGFELKLKINEEFIIVQNIKENKNIWNISLLFNSE